jgi:hypothetical protein
VHASDSARVENTPREFGRKGGLPKVQVVRAMVEVRAEAVGATIYLELAEAIGLTDFNDPQLPTLSLTFPHVPSISDNLRPRQNLEPMENRPDFIIPEKSKS